MNLTMADDCVHEYNYTQVCNKLIDNKKLSPLSKYLLIYLIKQKRGYVFHDHCLMKEMRVGVAKLKTLFSELRNEGYVKTVTIPGEKGQFKGKMRLFAKTPIYLTENKGDPKNEPEISKKLELVDDSPKVQLPNVRLTDRSAIDPCIKNTDLVKKTKINKNNKQEETMQASELSDPVVVSLIDLMIEKGLARKRAEGLMLSYGKERVREVLEQLDLAKPSNEAAWIVVALRDGYRFRRREVKKTPSTSPYPTAEETKMMLDNRGF